MGMAEKEYIERDKIGLTDFEIAMCNGDYKEALKMLLEKIESIPAADVRPVVRGRWIRHYEQADTGEDIITYPCGWVCSECGRWESEDEPFCNCGAMMEES